MCRSGMMRRSDWPGRFRNADFTCLHSDVPRCQRGDQPSCDAQCIPRLAPKNHRAPTQPRAERDCAVNRPRAQFVELTTTLSNSAVALNAVAAICPELKLVSVTDICSTPFK